MHAHGTGRVLKWSLAATVLFVIAEAIAGFKANSLALLSDAGHNFTDALALLLAWFGFYFQTKPADEVKTYGYHRAGILAAFVNALTLLGLAGLIFFESYRRFLNPRHVHETIMLIVAAAGLGVNLAIMWGLRRQQKHDLNIRSAFVHMLGDALGSVGIIVGAVAIRYTGWQRIDPVLSALIAALIVWTAWDIVRESLNILLEGLPKGMDFQSVIRAMREVEGVLGVHDLHIWSLGSNFHALSAHVLIEDMPPSESDAILRRLNKMLAERFHIEHTTVQFEHVNCPIYENGCCVQPENQRHQNRFH
ncbi:MAG: cation diffusion facilitator family transporter [Bryobacterales bacterium]|nr:cation diffusion facilitator family transporter [Bryobacteraceae bacterium]MDW8356198.1 cation diffusion facilitator family transporter [Bryobacterales bacterium]